MLCLVDQLLVTSPLVRRELGVDLGAHARLDGIEPWPHPRPQGIGLGAVTREDRADGVALRRAQVELPAQIGDHRIGSAPRAPPVAFYSLAAAPSGKSARYEHGGQEADGSELRSSVGQPVT